jgi:hypothetical protein
MEHEYTYKLECLWDIVEELTARETSNNCVIPPFKESLGMSYVTMVLDYLKN